MTLNLFYLVKLSPDKPIRICLYVKIISSHKSGRSWKKLDPKCQFRRTVYSPIIPRKPKKTLGASKRKIESPTLVRNRIRWEDERARLRWVFISHDKLRTTLELKRSALLLVVEKVNTDRTTRKTPNNSHPLTSKEDFFSGSFKGPCKMNIFLVSWCFLSEKCLQNFNIG